VNMEFDFQNLDFGVLSLMHVSYAVILPVGD
jgi:hypothetical protein